MARPSKENTAKEKFTIYLTSELSQKMKDLAYFNRVSISELFESISQEYAAKNEETLKIFYDAIKQAANQAADAQPNIKQK